MLNKKGWGFTELFVLMAVLGVFLIIAIYYIYNMYKEAGSEFNISYYNGLEEDLEVNALEYLNNYYKGDLTNEEIIISRDVLKNYGLDASLVDAWGVECSDGYVTASKSKGKINTKAYISCAGYKTEGYKKGAK